MISLLWLFVVGGLAMIVGVVIAVFVLVSYRTKKKKKERFVKY